MTDPTPLGPASTRNSGRGASFCDIPAQTSDFDYDLPPDLIAQEPSLDRESSRLLVLDRAGGLMEDSVFKDLPHFLKPGDLLVCNESRVIPARIEGRLPTGGLVELLLITRREENLWSVMAKPARKLREGVRVSLPNAEAVVTEVAPDGRRLMRFEHEGSFDAWLQSVGSLPIPPYIKRYPEDPERYQTVYSVTPGSVAAPTAGLHFSRSLLDRLRGMDVDVLYVTLHVGPGTFKTVRESQLEAIRLEAESGSLSASTASAIRAAKADGRRVIAVGTTTTRLLEGVFRRQGELARWSGEIDLFIRPPFEFNVVDALITNFHLPRSTLLMLVSAFAGHDRMQDAYRHAIEQRYRFYSFGDAMLIQ